MLTRTIDKALDAMDECAQRVPELRNIFRPGSPREVALSRVLDALAEAELVLSGRLAAPSPQPDARRKVGEGA